jgi:hypothetical protein
LDGRYHCIGSVNNRGSVGIKVHHIGPAGDRVDGYRHRVGSDLDRGHHGVGDTVDDHGFIGGG